MARLKSEAIEQSDLIQFVGEKSEFAFELSVLKTLIGQRFECEHGGTYEDPVTNKMRQFDIRAVKGSGTQRLRLAVECKQIGNNCPLLIAQVPRQLDESVHHLILSVDPDRFQLDDEYQPIRANRRHALTVPVQGSTSLYPLQQNVGKSCAQVGRDINDNIVGSDSEAFGKWSQAISSAEDLVRSASHDGVKHANGWTISLILPVLVVPDGRLWTVDFESDGTLRNDPTMVNRCSFYLDKACDTGGLSAVCYVLSHLEFVTVTGLVELVSTFDEDYRRDMHYAQRQITSIIGHSRLR